MESRDAAIGDGELNRGAIRPKLSIGTVAAR